MLAPILEFKFNEHLLTKCSKANTGPSNRVSASSPASVTGVRCESGLIAPSAGFRWQADAFADGTLEHNTPKQNNWGVNCSAASAIEARFEVFPLNLPGIRWMQLRPHCDGLQTLHHFWYYFIFFCFCPTFLISLPIWILGRLWCNIEEDSLICFHIGRQGDVKLMDKSAAELQMNTSKLHNENYCRNITEQRLHHCGV